MTLPMSLCLKTMSRMMRTLFFLSISFVVASLTPHKAWSLEKCESKDYQVYLEQVYFTKSGQEYLWAVLSERWSSAFYKHGRLGISAPDDSSRFRVVFEDRSGEKLQDLSVTLEPSSHGPKFQSVGLDLSATVESLFEQDRHLVMKVYLVTGDDRLQCIAGQKLLKSIDNGL